MRNVFIIFKPLRGWRHVKVTERRTKVDWAYCMKQLVYPEAVRIRRDSGSTQYPLIQLRCRRYLNQKKPSACWIGWSSTIPPSIAVGSIWPRSNSALYHDNVLTSASPMRQRCSGRWLPKKRNAMPWHEGGLAFYHPRCTYQA